MTQNCPHDPTRNILCANASACDYGNAVKCRVLQVKWQEDAGNRDKLWEQMESDPYFPPQEARP
jgi:hypothetical protein